jgi:hypothetical protein
MARIELSDADRYRIEQARKVLAEPRDFSNGQAVSHRLGRVEVALEELLQIFGDEAAV